MRQEIATQLVTALRSGDYTQCQGALHRGDDFCALGVLCDLKKDTKWIKTDIPETRDLAVNSPNGKTAVLPDHIITWAGILGRGDELMVLNDEMGMSFNTIADHIEKYWEDI